MPQKLESCVSDFMSSERNKSKWPDDKKRKQAAYAICNAAVKSSEDAHRGFVIKLDGEAPEWVHLLPKGEFDHPAYGDVVIDDNKLNTMVSNFNANVRGIQLDIDYAHKRDPAKGEKAAGWIKDLNNRSDGLWAQVDWTPTARQEIGAGEWKYLSAEFVDEWSNPEGADYKDVLLGGALTNRPFMKSLSPINLAELFEEDGSLFEQPTGKYAQDDPDANYREAGDSMYRCANCAFFEPTSNSCLVVEGSIDPDWTSNFFKPIYADSGMMYDESSQWYDPAEVMFYRDISQKTRNKMNKSDFAGKGTSFPIAKPEDVEAAAHALGLTKQNRSSIKSRIISIAKRKGSAFVAKLPASWKMEEEEVKEVEEFLKRLRERLGLPEDAAEEKVFEEIGAHKDFVEKKMKDAEKARKFAEEYPEEAQRLQELEKSNKMAETNLKIREWSDQKETQHGLPPALHEPISDFRMGLKGERLQKFDELVTEFVKTGVVDLSVRGGGDPTKLADDTDQFMAQIASIQNKAKEEGKTISFADAVRSASKQFPELAKAYQEKTIKVHSGEVS